MQLNQQLNPTILSNLEYINALKLCDFKSNQEMHMFQCHFQREVSRKVWIFNRFWLILNSQPYPVPGG